MKTPETPQEIPKPATLQEQMKASYLHGRQTAFCDALGVAVHGNAPAHVIDLLKEHVDANHPKEDGMGTAEQAGEEEVMLLPLSVTSAMQSQVDGINDDLIHQMTMLDGIVKKTSGLSDMEMVVSGLVEEVSRLDKIVKSMTEEKDDADRRQAEADADENVRRQHGLSEDT